MTFKKILALILAVLCLCSFAACSGEDNANQPVEDGSGLSVEDAEENAVVKKKVTVANVTGKDAVSMLVRPTGTEEWSSNVLSQDFFHTDKALELTYVETQTNIYDIRLVFADGTYEDFTELDYSAATDYIYLGEKE